MTNLSKMIQSKKVIIIAITIAVFLEIIWAGWTLVKGKSSLPKTPQVSNITRLTPKAEESSIKLQSPTSEVKVGETIKVSVNISSAKPTDGVDLIIKYNPKLLVVEASKGAALSPTSEYSSFPLNVADNARGLVAVSGISNKAGGTLISGLFGTITFKAKSVGKAAISVDYTPGSTIDSNIVETKTGRDLLNKVQNLEVNIIP